MKYFPVEVSWFLRGIAQIYIYKLVLLNQIQSSFLFEKSVLIHTELQAVSTRKQNIHHWLAKGRGGLPSKLNGNRIIGLITRLSWFRGPITKISQSDCSVAGPIFSKYWTGALSQMIPREDFPVVLLLFYFLKVFTPHKMLFLFSSNFVFLLLKT